MSDINKYRKGLVCLVPKRGSEFTMTCHEKTLCDCQVLEIFAAYDSLEAKLAISTKGLEDIIGQALWRDDDAWVNVKAIADQALAETKEAKKSSCKSM